MAFEGLNEKSWTEGDTLPLTNPGPGKTVKGKPVVADGFNAVFAGSGYDVGVRSAARVESSETFDIRNNTGQAVAPGAIIRWNGAKTLIGVDGQTQGASTFNGKVFGRAVQGIPANVTSKIWVKILQLAD